MWVGYDEGSIRVWSGNPLTLSLHLTLMLSQHLTRFLHLTLTLNVDRVLYGYCHGSVRFYVPFTDPACHEFSGKGPHVVKLVLRHDDLVRCESLTILGGYLERIWR